MSFKIVDRNRYYLKGTGDRYLHIATIQYNLREYMCFADVKTTKVFIEEITGGSLNFIEDDKLAQDLNDFLVFHKVLDMSKPLLPDDTWLRRKQSGPRVL